MLFAQHSIDESTNSPFLLASITRKPSSPSCDITDIFKLQSNDNVFLPGSISSDTIQPQTSDSYEYYIKRLDEYYRIICTQLIEYQSPTTGLFPIYGNKTCTDGKS